MSRSTSDAARRDRIAAVVLRAASAISVLLVALIAWFLIRESWPALRDIGLARFFTDPSWHPTAGRFNLSPMLIGTLSVTAGALLLGGPLGVGSALFLQFCAPARVAAVFRHVLELLAGVPSVVFGLWGLVVLAPILLTVNPAGQGEGLLAAVLILSMMTLPTVALASDAAIASVPPSHWRSGAALGMTRQAIALRIILPQVRGGIWTGLLLQSIRALGETMAVLMVCGNVVQTPRGLFAPIRTLTANIALEMGYADGQHQSVLFVSGLMLMILVIVLVGVCESVRGRWLERAEAGA